VEKALFFITCTTCRARLAVRNASAIGAILECPKCGSMVLVEPPADWNPAAGPVESAPGDSVKLTGKAAAAVVKQVAAEAQKAATPKPAETPKPVEKPAGQVVAPPVVRTHLAAPIAAPEESQSEEASQNALLGSSVVAAAFCPPVEVPTATAVPPVVVTPPSAAAPPTASPVVPAAEVPAGATPTLASQLTTWFSPTQPWVRWLVLGASPLVGLIATWGAWSLLAGHKHKAKASAAPVAVAPVTPQAKPVAVEEKPALAPLSQHFDRRWLPDGTRVVLSVRPSHLAKAPQAGLLAEHFNRWWCGATIFSNVSEKEGTPRDATSRPEIPTPYSALYALGLSPDKVRRLTWISTDPSLRVEHSVAVIELEADYDSAATAAMGQKIELQLAGVACRTLAANWPQPFAVVDAHTIVTGDKILLEQLAARAQPHLDSAPLDRLLKTLAADADATVAVDLACLRAAQVHLPAGLLDVWPNGRRAWRLLWEVPEGLGATLCWSESHHSEVALVCEGVTVADKARAAVDELMPAVKEAIPAQAQALRAELQAGKATAAMADQFGLLLEEGLAAVSSARWDVADGIVWIRIGWNKDPLSVVAGAIQAASLVRGSWLASGRAADEANQHHILTALNGYQKAEGQYPAGVPGGSLLPADTRLSWIAAMLPYFDHADWHRRLEFGYSWNGPQNAAIAHRPLMAVVNPVLGEQNTSAGFPVTHYVGVAGVRHNAAASLEAGVFGNNRGTASKEMTRGAANTIAILGVTEHCGPWAQGGEATARPLTQPPYVNGPDGFGSGQPEGMLAGMADGSVRFLSKDVDPKVVEQLATLNGPGDATAAALEAIGPAAKANQAAKKPIEETPKPAAPPTPPAAEHKAAEERIAKAEKPAAVEHVGMSAAEQRAAEARVAAGLATPVPQIRLEEMPLRDAVSLLAAMGGLPVAFDPDALEEVDASLEDRVSVNLSGAPLADVLKTILESRKLASVAENGYVLITTPAEFRQSLKRMRYTVGDLAGGDGPADSGQSLATLATVLQKLVAPEAWQVNGGRGQVEVRDGALQVLQTASVHRQILMFCEKLRTARGLRTRSRLDPAMFALTSRTERAQEVLGHVFTATYQEPTPLAEILAYLEKASGAEVLLDRAALHAAGMRGNVKGTLKVDRQPLGVALTQLLEPLGLAVRVVDAHTLQVTTRRALATRMELEFYPVGKLLHGGQASDLMERIRARVAPATWTEVGGPGVLYYDRPGQCLVVLQSQPAQAAVAAVLAEK
jgi:hypothetical protein